MPYREAPRAEHFGNACFYCGCVAQAGKCPSCMAEVLRAPGIPATCRRCGGSLAKNAVGHGCARCGGIFVTGEDWDRIVEALRSNSTVPHANIVPPPPGSAPNLDLVKNVACACCGVPMERAPFGARSAIFVDICPRHGIWLDSGELVGVLEHVRKLWRENAGHILSATEKREAFEERERLRVQIEVDKRRREQEARGRGANPTVDVGGVDVGHGGHFGGDSGGHHH